MKRPILWGLVILFLSISRNAAAYDIESFNRGPRVFAIQPRPFHLGHEFQLGLGVLPLNAFYVGMVPTASYTYHFSDFWGWEIASAGYSLNKDTSLETDLYKDYSVRPVNHGGDRIHFIATSSLVVKPLFGKLAIFNRDIVTSETFFAFGIGGVLLGKYPRPVANVGLGLRFWSTKTISWRLDLRDYLIFNQLPPENAFFISISAALNFLSSPIKPAAEVQP
ncbi:MAG: outer membrane beta-barrel domain-containing protein [Deltaproteobacteria bacterium]|nr:outer membrane beta-barrel domain-containing protein [Deltaproteobacteria bacterium]